MATNTAIKFLKKGYASIADAKAAATGGAVVFDTASHAIFVDGQQYGGNIADAAYSSNTLTITKADGTSSISLDFSQFATASSVQAALNAISAEFNNLESAIGNVDASDGEWNGYSGTNYIDEATSLSNADTLLDTAIKAVSDKVDAAVSEVYINNTSITDASDGEVNIAVDGTYNASTNKIATQDTVSTAIGALDGSATIATVSSDVVTLKAGLTETDGVVANSNGSDIVLAKVAKTGKAEDVSYAGTADVAGSEPATVEGALDDLYEKVNQAISAAGVTKFGGETGDITLGSYLTMGSGADAKKVSVTNVDTAGNSSTATDLATVKTVNEHVATAIGALDGSISGTPGAGNTVTAFSETDGVVTATFGAISITSSQVSDIQDTYSASDGKAISGKGVFAAIGTLDGSHNVATGAEYTPDTNEGESATWKIDLFDATETDGVVSTNNSASDTIYFSAQPTAANPVITHNDIAGLSGAMHYRGELTADPTVTTPTGTWAAGDVVTFENNEYVYNGSAWRVLGDEGSYALKTTTVTGAGVLTGGGALSQNQTISHTTITTPSSGTDTAKNQGESVTVMTGITGDGYGHVTGYTTNSFMIPTVNDATLTIVGASSGPISVGTNNAGDTFTANASSAKTITVTHAAAPTSGTPAAIKVAVDSYGHVNAGNAIESGDIALDSSNMLYNSTDCTTVDAALTKLNSSITGATLTIDGHKGAITTGNGLTAVASDGGSFAVKLDGSNSNGLSVGANGIAMAKATGSTFGTVEVTAGNGLSLSDGVVSYAHNTTAITVASKDNSTNVITINGTLTPDASDNISTSNAISLAAVAATGSASDVTVTSATYGGATATTNLQTALTNLAAKTASVNDGSEEIVVNASSATTIATVDGEPVSTKVAFYWEEYS
jgi:hypothetical protein